MSQFGSPADGTISSAIRCVPPSRSSSPKFNISDFELQLPPSAVTATRDTSYASQSAIDDLDFARSEQTTPNKYRHSITTTLFGKKLPPLITRATNNSNLPPTPPASQPASGAPSPTKSLTSFITSGSNTSSASKASTRAKTASKVIFDNFFIGHSAPVNIGILPSPHSRSQSQSTASNSEDEYDPEYLNMETSYTRAPARTRPRRSSTMQSSSTNYTSRFGSWFNGTKSASPKATRNVSTEESDDDPLLALDMHSSLFPHGPVDPLDPCSFNDLLTGAESLIGTLHSAYRARTAELRSLRSEIALREDEIEESETRAQHLKMQLEDMGMQFTAQAQKADMLEDMLRARTDGGGCDRCSSRRSSGIVVRGTASDSGFESDGDSVFSVHNSPVEHTHERQAAKVRMVRVERDRAPLPPPAPVARSPPSDLRGENQRLRIRVAELEAAVDGCLDLVSGPWALGR